MMLKLTCQLQGGNATSNDDNIGFFHQKPS
jgi:hypothetical protein